MPRPPFQRRVDSPPPCGCFKPAGVPARDLSEVVLSLDEYETLRLADFLGLYQEQVAEQMGVSRQTVGRILETARRKVASALVEGKVLRIEGGACVTAEARRLFACRACGQNWEAPFEGGRPEGCPGCGSPDFRRLDTQPRGCAGRNHGHGRGHGRGCGRNRPD